jgi:hypothetical protein
MPHARPSYSEAEFLRLIEGMVQTSGSQKITAQRLQVSPQYLNDVLHGRRDPGQKIYAAMGYAREVRYLQAGGQP